MSNNLLGPHGPGVNETLARPADSDSGLEADTWFKDCTSPTAGDGTKVKAVYLNKIKALIINACRGLGIPTADNDDDALLKCFQKVDRAIRNIGSQVGIYKARHADGVHELYSLQGTGGIVVALDAGANKITVDGTGIASGGGANLRNVGGEKEVYKGLSGGYHEYSTLKQGTGIVLTQNANDILIATEGGGGGGLTGKMVLAKMQHFRVAVDTSPTTFGAWAAGINVNYAPVKIGNIITIEAVVKMTAGPSTGETVIIAALARIRYNSGAGLVELCSGHIKDGPHGITFGSVDEQVGLMETITVPNPMATINFLVEHSCGLNSTQSIMKAGTILRVMEWETVT